MCVSVGALPNGEGATRVGIRTRRGFKGAVVRNRLKRQIRAVVFGKRLSFLHGIDILIVVHPPTRPASAALLESELRQLCHRLGLLSRPR